MSSEVTNPAPFPGFPDFRANVTFTPLQFFTVIIPSRSRGCVRIVGYALRKVLGWVDAHGNPTREQLRFTYGELSAQTGITRETVAEALQEALAHHGLRRIESPRKDAKGQPARSGLYELCWDQEGDYTDSPDEFHGFYYPEAAVLPVRQVGGVVRRPKAARKNIPNAFFDYLLPRERLSVIRVVGALLFYSIEWGPGGERKVPVSMSITELSRLTRLSRQHVHEAVQEARARGYIVQLDGGCFDPAAGQGSRAATYAIRWVAEAKRVQPATAPTGAVVWTGSGHRSEKVNGEPVGKGVRDRSEKVNGERSEKVNGISIKTELKTLEATAAASGAGSEPAAAAVQLLMKAGFDDATAQRLARKRPLAIIQSQLDWLPLRNTSRNRLGLLRRAIEQDWPKPASGEVADPASRLGRVFASHYYAAYHGLEGDAGTEPFPKDIQLSAALLDRLEGREPDPKRVPEWGRRFGQFMRDKHRGDARAKPNLSFALVLHGDEFLRALQRENAARHQAALGRAREAHHAAFRAGWYTYLQSTELRVQERHPELYAAFVAERRRMRHTMTGGVLLVSAEVLARFDSEPSRLAAFAEFFQNHAQCPVLNFWQWDERLNPQRFVPAAPTSMAVQPPQARP